MSSIKVFLLIVCFTALLNGCGNAKKDQAQEQLAEARSSGDLKRQEEAVQILLQSSDQEQAHWRQMLTDIQQVTKFNQQAQDALNANPFDALDFAGKADQLIYNRQSRQMIIDIISPYRDFASIYKPLREWAYPAIEKIVTPDSLGPGMLHWQTAAQKPSLWPDNALIALLTSKNHNPTQWFYGLSEERKAFVETFILISRMARNLPGDGATQALFEDAQIVNAMYNTILSDLHRHYLVLSFSKTIEFNTQWIGKSLEAIKRGHSSEQWQQIFNEALLSHNAELKRCCLSPQSELKDTFGLFEQPGEYDSAVQNTAQSFIRLITIDKEYTSAPEQFIVQAKTQTATLEQKKGELEALAQKPDRNDLATRFLYIAYTWQNTDIYELQRLLPYLKHYKTSIRGY